MAGSAYAASCAVGPCVYIYMNECLWFVGTSPLVHLMTEERRPQDAEDLSQCLSQQQSLQLKEEEDIPQRPKKYQFTDGCACTGPSIHCILRFMHPCIQLAKGKQSDRRMHQGLPGFDVSCHFFGLDEFCYGTVSTRIKE